MADHSLARSHSVHDGLCFADEIRTDNPRSYEANAMMIDELLRAASGEASELIPKFVRPHCSQTKPLFCQVNADRVKRPKENMTDWWAMRAHRFCEANEDRETTPPFAPQAKGKQKMEPARPIVAAGWEQRGKPPNAPQMRFHPVRRPATAQMPSPVRRGLEM